MGECKELIKRTMVTHQNVAHVGSKQEIEGSGQLDHYRTKITVWPFYYLATGTRDSSQSRDSLVYPVLLKNDFSYSILHLTINTLIPTKCRELPQRILRDKP